MGKINKRLPTKSGIIKEWRKKGSLKKVAKSYHIRYDNLLKIARRFGIDTSETPERKVSRIVFKVGKPPKLLPRPKPTKKSYEWYMSHPYRVKGIDKRGKPITWTHARIYTLPFTYGTCYFYRTGLERTKEYKAWIKERKAWKEVRQDKELGYDDLEAYKELRPGDYPRLVEAENNLIKVKQHIKCDKERWEYEENDPVTWYHSDSGKKAAQMKLREYEKQ